MDELEELARDWTAEETPMSGSDRSILSMREEFDRDAAGRPDQLGVPSLNTASWEPVDLGPYLDGSHVPETPSILARIDGRCLIYPGRTHSVVGEPGGMKSWLALISCVEQILIGCHVVYIDFEDIPAGLVARLLALGLTAPDIGEKFHYVRPSDPIGPERWQAMAATLQQYEPSLVVLDGVTEAMVLHGWELEKNSDVAKFLGALLRPLADAGPAVMQVDHVTKSADGRGRYALGAQHKLAGLTGAQYALEVFQPFGHGREGAARVRVAKDRLGWAPAPQGHVAAILRLLSGPDGGVTWSLSLPETKEAGKFRPTCLMERVSRHVEMHPLEKVTDVLKAVTGNRQQLATAWAVLVEEGYLEVDESDPKAKRLRSVLEYRETPATYEQVEVF